MIVGLTGPNAAGKGEAAAFFRKRGFTYLSLSDIIREEATRRGIEHSRTNLILIGNELRHTSGFGVLASRTNEKIRELPGDVVVDSIRSPYEVEELRKNEHFFLLGIDAPVDLRFQRARLRGRIENALSLEEFRMMEAKENTQTKGNQQLSATFALADRVIMNDGSLEDFHRKLDKFLAGLTTNHDPLQAPGAQGKTEGPEHTDQQSKDTDAEE
ncbi:MAG: AAA family ATPase [DPANN group archaeon]|nr:AAA family ATPase [DPANN group archaeon]